MFTAVKSVHLIGSVCMVLLNCAMSKLSYIFDVSTFLHQNISLQIGLLTENEVGNLLSFVVSCYRFLLLNYTKCLYHTMLI